MRITLKTIIIKLAVVSGIDLFVERLIHVFESIKEYRYQLKYGQNFTFVNQGPGGFCISGDPKKFSMGVGSHIKSSTFIECSGGVTIGRYFHTGRGLTIFSTSHNWKDCSKIPYDEVTLHRAVIIGDFVWAGANVTILPGTNVGEGVVIAAGSVVKGNIPELAVISGNPAVVICYRDRVKYNRIKNDGDFF